MKNKKVIIVSGKDEKELVDKLNMIELDIFTTQPKQKNNGSWVCFCYIVDRDSGKRSNMATEPQKKYIYKKNLDVNTENLTKKEAFRIISEDIEKRKKGKEKPEEIGNNDEDIYL